MRRVSAVVDAQPAVEVLPSDMNLTPSDFTTTVSRLEMPAGEYTVEHDQVNFPGQFRVKGEYVEACVETTHFEYGESIERLGRVLEAIGVNDAVEREGGVLGDTVMIGDYDFEFVPGGNGGSNPFVPQKLIDEEREQREKEEGVKERAMGIVEVEEEEGAEEEEFGGDEFLEFGEIDGELDEEQLENDADYQKFVQDLIDAGDD